MSNYNPYLDQNSYKHSYNMASEAIPSNNSFACFTDEKCLYQHIEGVPYPVVISNVENNHITSFDKKVISLVATYSFMTSKQIGECLTLLGVEFSDNVLKSSFERLKKNNILRACHFGIDEEHCAKFYAYSLNKYGSEIAKELGISHTFGPMQVALPPSDIKRKLATNQLMIAYFKSGLNVEWIKYGQVISSKEEKNGIVRPSLAVSFNNDVLFYETVRRGDYWEQYLKDKLERYKQLFDSWESNSWKLDASTIPILIILGENEEHNKEISKIVNALGIKAYFTHDILNCGSNFYHSIYQLTENSLPEYFCFEDEATVA